MKSISPSGPSIPMLIKAAVTILLLIPGFAAMNAQLLPGFRASGSYDEQQMVIENSPPGTRFEQKKYRYFGERAYSQFISDTLALPVRRMNIPARDSLAEAGTCN